MDIALGVGAFIIGGFLLIFSTSESESSAHGYFLGIMAIAIGARLMYIAGIGNLSDSLSSGEVREVVCTVPVGAKFGALLRKPDGELEAVFLSKDPPKNFVVTDNISNPYAPYPGK